MLVSNLRAIAANSVYHDEVRRDCERAANEIERLRAEAKQNFLREQDIIDAAAEIERLRVVLRGHLESCEIDPCEACVLALRLLVEEK